MTHALCVVSDDLLEALTNEVEACRQMVALTLLERASLEAGDVADLAAVVRDKETMLASLNTWHAAREQIIRGLTQDESSEADVSSARLPGAFDDAGLQALAPMQQELAELLRQLLALNHGNRLLIQADLAQIETTFSFLAQAAGPDSGTYTTVKGNHSKPVTGNMLNWEA